MRGALIQPDRVNDRPDRAVKLSDSRMVPAETRPGSGGGKPHDLAVGNRTGRPELRQCADEMVHLSVAVER